MFDEIAALVPGLTPFTVALVIAVCFAAAAIGGLSGFGTGIIIAIFITPILGAKAVIPVMSTLALIVNTSRFLFLRAPVDTRTIAIIAGTAVPASAAGALLYVRLESDFVQALLGAVLISTIPARRWLAARQITPGVREMVPVAGLYGFLSSIIIGAGMLIIPLLMGVGLAGTTLLATDAAIAIITAFARVVFFGSLEALTLPLFAIAIVMGAATVPGSWIAAWIVRRTDVRIHTVFVEAVILIGGTSMIVGAFV